MRFARIVLVGMVGVGLAAAPAFGRCSISLMIKQAEMGGNLWTDPGRSYGGWFWLAGRGNNLINANSSDPEAGVDSGLIGGVPPVADWLPPINGDPSMRAVNWDWYNGGNDGCGDANSNSRSDPDEVIAVLVVDDRAQEFAAMSVGGGWQYGWDFSKISNGVPSFRGNATSGVPMQPVPRPTLGVPREAAGGRVEVEVTPPAAIRTFDDIGGSRQIVQGFHILQNDLLLAEIGMGGGSARVKATPGQPLVLRTIFGFPGDAGFYVDSSVMVPAAGQQPEEPPSSGGDRRRRDDAGRPDEPGPPADEAGPGDVPAAEGGGAAALGAVGAAAGEAEEPADNDEDEDEILDDDDNCPEVSNADQEDMDEDGVGDFCDCCPFDANPGQDDADDDGLGDACDPCPLDPGNQDGDADGLCDGQDNCDAAANPGQEDRDGDGDGDACDSSFDPWVLGLEARAAKVKPGGSAQLRLSLTNRSSGGRKAAMRLVWRDAAGAEAEVAASEQCLTKVPMQVEVGAGDRWNRDCSVPIPAGAKAGQGTFLLKVVDGLDDKVRVESTATVTVG